ncbi:MATE family efflux transporter [uncultured Cetobacterium sp.]|uniref:MATE family efflux transporter n=1 Tax=uncultured Cetobacterium sp. TaxID=527638 RepID=UPI002606CAE0|nr:MATE family efflux transporter [uncultured Cetobacterium sp.]
MKNINLKFEGENTLITILKFSLPSSFGSIIGMLCVLTDRYFIGQVAGRGGMAAVALVFPYAMIINSFNFLFSGIAINIGVKLGENKTEDAQEILTCGFLWIIITGFFLSFFLWIFNDSLLSLLGASKTNFSFAKEYTKFLIPISIFQMFLGQSSLIRGVGDSVSAMGINIATGVINIILDYIFIIKLNMGLKGASLATFIATFLTGLYVVFYFYKSPVITYSKKYLHLNLNILKDIFKIGSPRFYNQLLQSALITSTNRQAGFYGGDIATAAIGIISITRSIINTSLQGFNQGTAAIISYSFGSHNLKRIKEVLKIQLFTVIGISSSLVFLILVHADFVVKFFIKNDPILVKFTVHAMRLNLCLMIFTAIFLACNNFFQAIKRNKIATNFFFIRILLLNIPLVYILPLFLKENGVWLAFPISDTIVCFLMGILTYKEYKKFI